MLRDRFLVDAVGLWKVEGRPFRIREIREKIEDVLGEMNRDEFNATGRLRGRRRPARSVCP